MIQCKIKELVRNLASIHRHVCYIIIKSYIHVSSRPNLAQPKIWKKKSTYEYCTSISGTRKPSSNPETHGPGSLSHRRRPYIAAIKTGVIYCCVAMERGTVVSLYYRSLRSVGAAELAVVASRSCVNGAPASGPLTITIDLYANA